MTTPDLVIASGRTYRPESVTALTGTLQLYGRGCLLGGWSVKETTGAAAATVQLFAGADNRDQLVADINLLASESVRDVAPGDGIECDGGVAAVVTAGSVTVVVWTAEP